MTPEQRKEINKVIDELDKVNENVAESKLARQSLAIHLRLSAAAFNRNEEVMEDAVESVRRATERILEILNKEEPK